MARSLCILIFSTIGLGGIFAVTGQNVKDLQEDVNQLKTEVAQLKRELALEKMKVHSTSGMIRNTPQYQSEELTIPTELIGIDLN